MKSAKEVLDKFFRRPVRCSRGASVVSCSSCKGVGFVFEERLTCYHKREYTSFTQPCTTCGTSGRVIEVTYKLYAEMIGYQELPNQTERVPGTPENMQKWLSEEFGESVMLTEIKGTWR